MNVLQLSPEETWKKVDSREFTPEELSSVKKAYIKHVENIPHVEVVFTNNTKGRLLIDFHSNIDFTEGKEISLSKCIINTIQKGEVSIPRILIIE